MEGIQTTATVRGNPAAGGILWAGRATILGALCVCLAAASWAQVPSLLRDLNTGDYGPTGSAIDFLGGADGTVFFAATDGSSGTELWMTRGTTESTRQVADLCPGWCSSTPLFLGSVGDRSIFAAHEGGASDDVALFSVTHGEAEVGRLFGQETGLDLENLLGSYPDLDSQRVELPAKIVLLLRHEDGTYLLAGVDGLAGEPEILRSFPSEGPYRHLHAITALDGSRALFFRSGNPDDAPPEVWLTDGTSVGTLQVATLPAQAQVQQSVTAGPFAYLRLRVGFDDALWVSDATSAGTLPVTAFLDPTSAVGTLRVIEGVAYFGVRANTLGEELWRSDGTASGTLAITEFGFHNPFGGYDGAARAERLVVLNGTVFFIATDGIHPPQLWLSLGRPDSMRVVADICDYCDGPSWVAVAGTSVVFPGSSAAGAELMATDSAGAEPDQIGDLCPGTCAGAPRLLATLGDSVLLAADDLTYGEDLWVTRGTPDTTVNLTSPLFDPYGARLSISNFAQLDGRFLFDGEGVDSARGLWSADSTPASAQPLANPANSDAGSAPSAFASAGERTYFLAYQDGRSGLLRTDGTAAGTVQMEQAPLYCSDSGFDVATALGDDFVYANCHGYELLRLRPDEVVPEVLAAFPRGENLSSTTIGADLYLARYADPGHEIWRSDGTLAGTGVAMTLPETTGFGSDLVQAGGRILFVGYQDGFDILSAVAEDFSGLEPLTPAGQRVANGTRFVPGNAPLLFFQMNAIAGSANEIWRTDGTSAGSLAVTEAPWNSSLIGGAATNGWYALLVGLGWGDSEVRLLRSDGTPQGTFVLKSIPTLYQMPSTDVVAFGGHVFFLTHDLESNTVLWASDGTSEGTRAVMVTAPPTFLDTPLPELAVTPLGLFFVAYDAAHGTELWTLEDPLGTPRRVADILPGLGSSNPNGLHVAPSGLYFAANDGLHGEEPWLLPFTGGAPCVASAKSLCLENGRFRAEAYWRKFDGVAGDAVATPLSADTGYFWFFDEANVELILKVLDGTGFNGHHWVYYGALSNVEYTMTLTDTQSGATKRYFNPAGRFASAGDITAFGPLGAHVRGELLLQETESGSRLESSSIAALAGAGASGTCVASPTRFCIFDGRFAVEATWRDFHGNTGVANAGTISADTGFLWFFDESNVEVVLKAVDGASNNGHYWVYFGALSNVEYMITVTDTVTGVPRQYRNALGKFASFGDIEAFPAP